MRFWGKIYHKINYVAYRMNCKIFLVKIYFDNLVSELFNHTVYFDSFINIKTFKQVLIADLRPIPAPLLAECKDNVTGTAGSSGCKCTRTSLSI